MKASALILVVSLSGAFAATASTVAIAQEPEPGAGRVLTETLYDVSEGAFVFPCSETGELLPEGEGEPVAVEGYFHERFMSLENPSGGVHYSVNTRPLGIRGVGEATGEEFRVRDSVQFVGHEQGDGLVLSYHQEFEMVGTATQRTFWITARGHYLIQPDGTIRLHRDTLQVGCRG
jgi:hypothetical protein